MSFAHRLTAMVGTAVLAAGLISLTPDAVESQVASVPDASRCVHQLAPTEPYHGPVHSGGHKRAY